MEQYWDTYRKERTGKMLSIERMARKVYSMCQHAINPVSEGAYRSDRSFIEHLATQFESRTADIALKPGVKVKSLVTDT